MKRFFVFIIGAAGFIASILGIIQFLQSALHFGNILIPNPIIIVVAILVSIISWCCVFYLGSLYGVYSFFTGFFKSVRKSYPFWKFFFGYCREWFIQWHGKRKKESALVQRLYELKTKGLYDAKTKKEDYAFLSLLSKLPKERKYLNIQIIPELKVTRGKKITRERYDAKQ